MRLIDAYALLKKVYTIVQTCDGYETIERVVYADQIEDAPTIDAVPVVHGHWIDSGIDGFDRCSNCKAIWDVPLTKRNMFFRHCPRCGAKMDETIPLLDSDDIYGEKVKE